MFHLVPILGILLGLGLLGWCAYLHALGKGSRSWPPAEGTILRAGVRVQGRRSDEGRDYAHFVVYQYTVGGRLFQGDRIAIGGKWVSATESEARRQIERYRVGAKVRVFYDPSDPAFSVLQRGAQNIGWLLLIAAVFIGISAFMLVSAPR